MGDSRTNEKVKEESRITSATYMEWQASLFGACFIAFGLGLLLASQAMAFAPWAILIGAGIHGWGMYRIHRRNNS